MENNEMWDAPDNGLGFQIEGEHRFAPHLPVFMTISRDGLSLYLSRPAAPVPAGRVE